MHHLTLNGSTERFKRHKSESKCDHWLSLSRWTLTRCMHVQKKRTLFSTLVNFTFESFPHRLKQVFVSLLNLPGKEIIRQVYNLPWKIVLWNLFFVKANHLWFLNEKLPGCYPWLCSYLSSINRWMMNAECWPASGPGYDKDLVIGVWGELVQQLWVVDRQVVLHARVHPCRVLLHIKRGHISHYSECLTNATVPSQAFLLQSHLLHWTTKTNKKQNK